MGGRILIVGRHRSLGQFTHASHRGRRRVRPAKDGGKMEGEGQIAQGDRVVRLVRQQLFDQPACLSEVHGRESPDVPVGAHDPIPRVQLGGRLAF